MKIAVFVKNLTSGGAEKQSVLLAKSLCDKHQVHYVIFNKKKIHEKYLEMLNEGGKIKVVSFDGGHVSRFNSFVKYLKENDISYIFSYLTAANFYASVAGLLTGSKVYIGLRNAKLPFLKHLADMILTNFFSEGAVTNCFSGRDNFSKRGFIRNKIHVIPNCFYGIKEYNGKRDNDIVNIITVGRFVAQKDYETAIASVAELFRQKKYIHFSIIGYGVLENKIKQWITKYGISDITSIYLNPPNIPQLLDNADIYLSTSLFEGTSNSIMEGMNANLPIVATDVGDNRYLVKDKVNGYICTVKDVKSISAKLSELVQNKSQRTQMGKKSKDILQKEYSVDIFKRKYLQLIEKE